MGAYISSVVTNMESMFTQRQLGITGNQRKKSTEKLSSGYKINRAADDAAGLTISEKMRSQIRGLTQASANVQDGVSLAQVADGYLDEVHDMLHRLTELAVQASNGTLQDEDRASINKEVDALKSEMRRIFKEANFNEIPLFHVPFTPDFKGYPNDMHIFRTADGKTAGLEFNNVRYNIAELQSKGLKIDLSGRATEDFEVSFKLWDGETVDLSMKEGDDLSSAVRNYKWKATDDGIYINDRLSAEWNEVRDENGNGITDTDHIASGTYTFSHHGMKISFDVDEEADLDTMFAGINGDLATKPATWDVSAGSAKSLNAADIQPAYQTVTVKENNKNTIDRDYTVVADADGIRIRATDKNDPSVYKDSATTSWSLFKDSSKANLKDENDNPVETGGGYPIRNWGDTTDGYGKDQITFDGDATYSFSGTVDNVKIDFKFKLAESANLKEVMDALNGASCGDYGVSAPGSLSAQSTSTIGQLSVGSNKALANSFALQRQYGRNFDDSNATLSANISVERKTIAGQNSADDSPYASGHRVTHGSTASRVQDTGATTKTLNNTTYRVVEVKYWDDDVDGEGNPVYETDMNGDPVLDGEGNPVIRQKEYTRYDYYEIKDSIKKDYYDCKYNSTDSWDQSVTYSFTGSLTGVNGTHNMSQVDQSTVESYTRSFVEGRRETVTYHVYDARKLDDSEVDDTIRNNAASAASAPVNYREGSKTSTFSGYSLISKGAETLYGLSRTNFDDIDFNNAFEFSYNTNIAQASTLSKSSGPQSLGAIKFTASSYATRDFYPTEKSATVDEKQFNVMKLIVPKKNLDIQAGAHEGQVITMEWSPLNLTILGISNADTSTQSQAHDTIDMVQSALDLISETRSTFGAYQNRFESTIRNLDNIVENTQAAESLIRDTDMATEAVKNAKENILMQAGSAMLVHNNQSRQGILSLLQ